MSWLLALLSGMFASPPPVEPLLQRQMFALTMSELDPPALCPVPIRLKVKKLLREAAVDQIMAEGCALSASRKAPIVHIALVRSSDGLVIASLTSRHIVLMRGFRVDGDKAIAVTALSKSIKDLT